MPRSRRSRSTATADYWPGFVDALTALLLVLIFLLTVFALAQFFLGTELSEKDDQVRSLEAQIAELASQLSLARGDSADLTSQITSLTASLTSAQDSLRKAEDEQARLNALLASLRDEKEAQGSQLVALETKLADTEESLAQADDEQARLNALLLSLQKDKDSAGTEIVALEAELEAEQKISVEAQAEIKILNDQIAALRLQMTSIQEALEAAEAKDRESQAIIEDLGSRLNVALAQKVQELASYRSDFFEQLGQALGERAEIEVVGDRFVLQSEILFASGSATLNPAGRAELAKIAEVIKDIGRQIPDDVDWILRVDGHSDRVPINTPQFPSNWHLSSARAISVIDFLVSRGVDPSRLSAAGFGEFRPLDQGGSQSALRRNRRIEFLLTDR